MGGGDGVHVLWGRGEDGDGETTPEPSVPPKFITDNHYAGY